MSPAAPKVQTLETANTTPPKPAASPLQKLVALEGEVLAAADRLSLKHIAVNRTRALIPAGHIFWLTQSGRRLKIAAISSQATVDNNAPFVQWITAQMEGRLRQDRLSKPAALEFSMRRADDDFSYPFPQGYYAPFRGGGGLLLTREHSFTDIEQSLILRLSRLFGASWDALGDKKRARMSGQKRRIVYGVSILTLLAGLIPVPMTTLAPAEIIAAKPFIVTAPMDGVIDAVLVPANVPITKGQPLVQMVDTSYRNEYNLAGSEEVVADARLRQAGLSAFIDETAKREIAIAEAEKRLALTRKNYAKDRLSKTLISAPMEGLALFSKPQDWSGRPVSTGEAIMQIADPTRVSLRIDAPLSSGEVLQSGARVRMFLDADPLRPIEARLGRSSYYAENTPDGHMAYQVQAKLGDGIQPRIGSRGVAKIYGRKAPLGYWLLRRPLTIIRQFFGA